MKLKITILGICVLLITATDSSAQHPFYDALRLEGYLVNNELPESVAVASILVHYLDITGDSVPHSVVFDHFEDHPFIRMAVGVRSSGTLATTTASVISRIGGIPVTTIAEGIAKFLVARTKQELSVAFFQRFKEELNNPKYEHLATLFAETKKVLEAAGDEIYRFNLYLTMMREAFKRDLSRLPITVQEVVVDPSLGVPPEIQAVVLSGSILAEGLVLGRHPADILYDSEFTESFSSIDPDLGSALTLYNIFSQSLKSRGPDRYWVSSDSLALLNGPALRIYLGLVYENVPEHLEVMGDNIRDMMRNIADLEDKVLEVRDYLFGLIDRVTLLQNFLVELKEEGLKNSSIEEYSKYFNEVVDYLEYTLEETHFPGVEVDSTFTDEIERFINNARLVNDIFLAVKNKNYASALFSTSVLLGEVLGDDPKFRQMLLKYGSFMVAIVKAEDSDQVQEVIEAAALPPGSASIKRNTKSNISLNAYVGLMVGRERLDATGVTDFTAGITAPVGIAISRSGNLLGFLWNGSHTAFFSLIDVGAITAYRFNDDESEPLPEMKLQNILAPGLSYVWGIPKSPISIGFGAQLGPALRSIDSQGLEIESNYRFHAFIAVDIPLINFHTVPR